MRVPSFDPVSSLPAAPRPSLATHLTAAEEATAAVTVATAEEEEEEATCEGSREAVVAAASSADVASDEHTQPVTCTGSDASWYSR